MPAEELLVGILLANLVKVVHKEAIHQVVVVHTDVVCSFVDSQVVVYMAVDHIHAVQVKSTGILHAVLFVSTRLNLHYYTRGIIEIKIKYPTTHSKVINDLVCIYLM